jgi:hypothetical protein
VLEGRVGIASDEIFDALKPVKQKAVHDPIGSPHDFALCAWGIISDFTCLQSKPNGHLLK